MGNTTHFSTKERILGAAEELFAQHGFAGTSLRQVTSRADVNIAAVNYHFGSKDNLVHEVFRRRMDVMSAQRLEALAKAVAAAPGELEPILAALVDEMNRKFLTKILYPFLARKSAAKSSASFPNSLCSAIRHFVSSFRFQV